MSFRLLRAFVVADVLFRFRRASSLVLLAIMLAASWLWVPDPATGRALIVVESQRALYTAGSIGMATASLATLFIGLFGFYAVSNAVARDTQTRVGQMLASTPLSKTGYILGRFVGNIAYLSSMLAVYALGSFAMVWVRGEGSLDVWRFASQYLLLCTPAVVGVSSLALLFEVTPVLRTRAGDVGFFFLWMTILGMSASSSVHDLPVYWLDLSGFAWMLEHMQRELGTTSFGIGATNFDVTLPPVHFDGIPLTVSAMASRLSSTLIPLALLLPVIALFHRFDPARIRAGGPRREGRRVRLAFLSSLVEWIPVPGSGGLAGAALRDARITILERPWTILAILVAWIAGLAGGKGAVAIVVIVAGATVAGLASRERSSGTAALVHPSPVIAGRRGLWKLAGGLVVTFATGLPLFLRLLSQDWYLGLRFAGGLLLVAGTANLLGFLTGGGRTFLAILLAGVYIAVNASGVAGVDFAGFSTAPPSTAGSLWLAAALVLAVASVLAPRFREG